MIKNIFRPAIWERIWKFTVQMQMQPMWFWKYHNATLLWEALSTHFCDSCGKYTISDNVLGDHIEFYSDTEAFSTHSNCDLCGKYTFWHSTATQRRGTVSTHYNCDWCGKLHDSWQGFGTHRRETGSTYFNGDWCVKNTIPDSVLGSHWIPTGPVNPVYSIICDTAELGWVKLIWWLVTIICIK